MQIYMVHRAKAAWLLKYYMRESVTTESAVTTCSALKWAVSAGVSEEGNRQDTVERSRWEKRFPFMCCVKSQISADCCNKYTSRSIMSVILQHQQLSGSCCHCWHSHFIPTTLKTLCQHESLQTERMRLLSALISSLLICWFNWHLHFFHCKEWLTHPDFWLSNRTVTNCGFIEINEDNSDLVYCLEIIKKHPNSIVSSRESYFICIPKLSSCHFVWSILKHLNQPEWV